MKIKRLIIHIFLFVGLVMALYVLITTLRKNEWNTVAGSLAVITAIISAWNAQRIIWKQEDELEPKLIVFLDLKSKVGITQFVVENIGGSTAHKVRIEWQKPLINHEDKEIHFVSGEKGIDFRKISKGQRFACIINGTTRLFQHYDSNNELLEFWGILHYKTGQKKWFEVKEEFFLSLEPYRESIIPEDEYSEYLHEGKKLHKDLIELNKTLLKINNNLNPENNSTDKTA